MRWCVRTVLILRVRLVRLGQGKAVFVLWIVPVPMCQAPRQVHEPNMLLRVQTDDCSLPVAKRNRQRTSLAS